MENVLVSVVVISFNSAPTILETLDSIYAQTYQNIELILSDDGSSDHTVALAQQWAQTHSHRFAGCQIRQSEQNMGVPHNANAGVKLATGHYLKLLAADDILLPNAIAQYVDICQKNNWDNVCCQVQPFCTRNSELHLLPGYDLYLPFFQLSAQEQYQDELVDNRILSPAFFCTRELIEVMGYYDLRYRLMEDYPIYLKMCRSGVQFHALDVVTVQYRISESSISNATSGRAVHPAYQKCVRRFFYQQRLFPLLKYGKLKRAFSLIRTYLCNDLAIFFGNDKKSALVRFFVKLGGVHGKN